jgi:hypothetical protein
MNQIKNIRSIATQLQAESSIHDPSQTKLARIVDLCDDLMTHFVDDGR